MVLVMGVPSWLALPGLESPGLKDILIACCDGLKGFPQRTVG